MGGSGKQLAKLGQSGGKVDKIWSLKNFKNFKKFVQLVLTNFTKKVDGVHVFYDLFIAIKL